MGTASNSILQTHSAAESSSVPALLAIKRFVRRTLRQAGLSGLSLMLILGLVAHTPREQALSSYPAGQPNNAVIVQADYGQADQKADQKADERTSHNNDKRSFQNVDSRDYSSAISTQTLRPHRLLSATMTHHHLTGARLTVPGAQHHRDVRIADAQ
ncbi:MAG: hypothetical protein AAFY33_16475 [Cyanobacteria bacterium J06643_4]